MNYDDLQREKERLLPLLTAAVNEVRNGRGSQPTTGDPRSTVKQLFGSSVTRPALLTFLGLKEGLFGEGDFYAMCDAVPL